MSFCDEIDGKKRCFNTDCCGNSRASGKSGYFEARITSCNCQSNVGCLDRSDCGILRSTGTDAYPGPCQCVEEEIWNSNAPPKPNCQWLSNFAELRRQWSDHGRQRACKCCSCSRPCRTVAPCRPSLSPTAPCSGTILTTSDCQKCCGNRRLAGGASKSEMTPIDKSSPERPLKREAGGGCSPPSCTYPSTTRCNSPNTDYSSTASSCCTSQCRYSQASSCQTSDCRPCASLALKSILKKRSCCQCKTNHCMCQPIPRGCNCPPPVQVDARAAHVACSCDSPSSPECACPPNERRFPKTTVKCPNARLCCPLSRLPPGPRCHCARCQPCPPPPCDPCASTKCRGPVPPKNPCRPCSPCPSCPSCRPVSHSSSCRPPTPSRKLTFCTERGSRLSSPCTGTGQSSHEIIGDRNSEICSERNDVENREKDSDGSCDCCCATDCTGSEDESENDYPDESCIPILDEGSVEISKSKTFINSESESTNLSKSVDPDSYRMPEKTDGSTLENVTEAFEGCTTEKSSKDSIQHTSSTYVLSDNDAKSDRYTFPTGEHPPVGKNISVNPVLARLSNRMRSAIRIKQQDLSAPNKLLPQQAVTFRDIPRAHVGPLAGVSVSTTHRHVGSTDDVGMVDPRKKTRDRL